MRSAICLVVRNEARDILEWIAFHSIAGFDTQIIFDNNSTDGTRDLVAAAGRVADVRYHHWGRVDANYQVDAYFTACHVYRHDFDWIAFVDCDEFVVADAEGGINALLDRYQGCGGVGANWAVYGSSGYQDYPAGPLTASFLRRSTRDFFPNRHVKSVVRPLNVLACRNPHCFDLDAPYVMADGRPLDWFATERGETLYGMSRDLPMFAPWRINHYFTRSRAHWDAKMRRGYPADIAVRKNQDFIDYDRNEILDGIASRQASALTAMMATIRRHRSAP